ncbi:hypothetical protein JCM5350_003992 [Sporobolomyces pararoseus]
MEEQLSISSSSIPQSEVRGLFEKYTHLASTPPSPSGAELAIETEEKSQTESITKEANPTRVESPPNPVSISDSLPFLPPPFSSPPRPLPHPTAYPGVLQASPRVPSSLSWTSEISSVYRIKLLVARLAAFRLVRPLQPEAPTRSELELIHEMIHYIRGLARGEDSIELERDKNLQQGLLRTGEREDRIRNVQCVTLFRVLTRFHPEFVKRLPGKEECFKVMRMVSEAVDDQRTFEELFDSEAFSETQECRKRSYFFKEGGDEEEDEEYQPFGQRSNKKKKKKEQDASFDGKGKTRKSLRTQVLTRSISKGPGSQTE